MHRSFLRPIWLLVALLVVLGCAQPPPTAPLSATPDIPATVTAQVQMQPTLVPTPTAPQTQTPYPTYTPYPTLKPLPTHTPYPAPTATLRPTVDASRTLQVEEMRQAKNKFWQDGQPILLIGCRATDKPMVSRDSVWYSFSINGLFGSKWYMANVTGFVKAPKAGGCYEMVVRYDGSEKFCFYTEKGFPSLPPGYGCIGWVQETPSFYLVDGESAHYLPRNEWRAKYLN